MQDASEKSIMIPDMVDEQLLRDVPGWSKAPVPACYGGDPRSLTFCCHPGYPLTFSFKCRRDALLKEVGLTKDEFVKIKDEFAKKNNWNDERVCFKNLSYCCMRRGGCPGGRDHVLKDLYKKKGRNWDGILEQYFSRKRELSLLLLKASTNQELVKPFIDAETDGKNT
jgi:predicted metal-binding transcription factor (methanogenesis marker protein 9)